MNYFTGIFITLNFSVQCSNQLGSSNLDSWLYKSLPNVLTLCVYCLRKWLYCLKQRNSQCDDVEGTLKTIFLRNCLIYLVVLSLIAVSIFFHSLYNCEKLKSTRNNTSFSFLFDSFLFICLMLLFDYDNSF